MSEPIRLFALSKSGVISTDIDGDPNGRNLMVFVDSSEAATSRLDGEEIVELAEVHRCGTCAHSNARLIPGGMWCRNWEGHTLADGWCHAHKEKTDG